MRAFTFHLKEVGMTRTLTALPVYNEASHLLSVLQEVRKYCDEILVVNDGSSDGTAQLLADISGLHTITHAKNQGYGGALRSAFHYAIAQEFDGLVTIDCDGQHEPRLIPKMIEKLFSSESQPIDIVSGSRYLTQFPNDSIPPEERRRINLDITRQLNRQLGWRLTDAFCGFKAYRVESLKKFHVTELGYAMPLQLWAQAAAAEMNILEFPVPLIYLDEERSFGGSIDDATLRLSYYRRVLHREMSALSIMTGLGCGDF